MARDRKTCGETWRERPGEKLETSDGEGQIDLWRDWERKTWRDLRVDAWTAASVVVSLARFCAWL